MNITDVEDKTIRKAGKGNAKLAARAKANGDRRTSHSGRVPPNDWRGVSKETHNRTTCYDRTHPMAWTGKVNDDIAGNAAGYCN
jgi:cysteinyl-tRNA synthetase